MYVIELFVPWLTFGPRRLRHAACVLLIGLQLGIELTGNYGFFNLLSIVLCLPLLDDELLGRVLPQRWAGTLSVMRQQADARQWWLQESRIGRIVRAVPPVCIMIVSSVSLVQEMVRSQNPEKLPSVVTVPLDFADRKLLSWGAPYLLDPLRPLRSINGYGLFRVMTTERRDHHRGEQRRHHLD
jgi:hypothetical protein